MRKIFGLIFLLSILLVNFLSATEMKTIAVLDFSNNSIMEKEKYASLTSGLAEILITELGKVKSLQVVERKKINEIIKEMQLAQSGLISEETGVTVGKLLGAKYLVFGSYMVFDKKIRVDIRIVEVETGLTIKAEEVTNKTSKMFEIIQELSEKILKDLDIELTKEEKNLLKASDTSTEVINLFSKGLEFEEARNMEMAKEYYIKAFKMDKNFKPARKRLKALLLRQKNNKN